jgi:hypothetical protein
MLADAIQVTSPQTGCFGPNVQRPATLLHELLDFIASELPLWRDREERPDQSSENTLTAQLCSHLNSSARRSQGWDIFQFRREEPDESKGNRSIDLVVAPCGVRVWMHGRCFHDFQPLLPIECKRLPTPSGNRRDKREYVFTEHGSTGGIQRYKAGHHGAIHELGAMIGYVQEGSIETWNGQVDGWIRGLASVGEPHWSLRDLLKLKRNDRKSRIAILSSVHARQRGLSDIELRHLWIVMAREEG